MLNPQSADVQYSLGRFYVLTNDDKNAELHFQRACSLNPRHRRSYYRLSRLALRRGEKQKARELAEVVSKLLQHEHLSDKNDLLRRMSKSIAAADAHYGRQRP